MTNITNIGLRITNFIYNLKVVRLFRIICLIFIISIGVGVCVAYGMHFLQLVDKYGKGIVSVTYIPNLLFGLILGVFFLFYKRKEMAKLSFFFGLFPSTLLTESGITADLYFTMALIIYLIEKAHRKEMVETVAMFSKKYSPLYKERLANKDKYSSYKSKYRILEFLNENDYELLSEVVTTEKNHKSGIAQKSMVRTFKIKGMFGKITIKDNLYFVPQKRFLLGRK